MKTQRVFKLTRQDLTTHSGCQWVVGKWNPTGVRHGKGGLCADGFYHAYPFLDGVGDTLALIRNGQDANISNPRLWLAEVRGPVTDADDFCKVGAMEQRIIREIPSTPLTTEDRVALSIHLAGVVQPEADDRGWQQWAEGWLAGTDRSYAAAYAAANAAANAVAYAAVNAAANAAAYAANADRREAAHAALRDAIVAWRGGIGT